MNSKVCPDCSEEKPLSEFPRNRSTKTGFATYCKPCHNIRTRENIRKNHGDTRTYHLRQRYGITPEQFDAIVASQGGLCAICAEREPTHLDHNHETGAVRGALCVPCNNGLGLFSDDLNRVAQALEYLIKHRRLRACG